MGHFSLDFRKIITYSLLIFFSGFIYSVSSAQTPPPTVPPGGTPPAGSGQPAGTTPLQTTDPALNPQTSTDPPPAPDNNTEEQKSKETETADDMSEGDILDEYSDDWEMREKRERGLYMVDGLVIFGSQLFSQRFTSSSINQNQPPPSNYIIGPNDKIRIDVTGKSLVSWEPTVQPDGSILLDRSGIGKIFVSGKNIETVSDIIKNTLSSYGYAIGNGTYVDVSLVSVRSFTINMVGEIRRPGTKTVNTFTTVLDALYLSGGITINGSYRYIQVIRDNRIYAEVDLYDMLINGDFSSNIYLENNDIIRIPVYRSRVGIYGEVKRSAMFEVKQGETLRDVLKFAGGFTEFAYSSMIKVRQVTDKELKLRDIYFENYDVYIPMNGDRYSVDRILDRVENRVTVQGQVFRPGSFELESTMTILQLIEKAGGLKEEAFLSRAYLTRMNPVDNRMENISIDLEGIVNGKVDDIRLQREDVLNILSIYELSDVSTVTIVGRVRGGGTFTYYPGITIEDLILKANGFQDGADFMNVKIARRINNSNRRSASAQLAEIIDVTLDPYLTVSDKNMKLEPYDVVYVYPFTGYSRPITVSIEGEVLIPGSYPMVKKDNRISDLITRAGGMTELANIKGATLYRVEHHTTSNERELEQYHRMNRNVTNQLSLLEKGEETSDNFDRSVMDNRLALDPRIVTIDLQQILKKPGSPGDLILKEGDRLSIPAQKHTVSITGNVGMPTIAVYQPGKSLLNYINNDAGGFTELSFRKKTQVRYPNGRVKVKTFLGGFPQVEPGSVIYVPYKKQKVRGNSFNLQSILAVTASLSSSAAIVVALLRLRN